MRDLSVLEQLILAAIISLGDEAYSMAIRKRVRQIANKNIMYGTLYNVMDQLLRKEYVTKAKGELVPDRRGRRRMYYKPTTKGKEALLKAFDLHEAIWANLQDLVRTHRE
ncbi:MAG: helix-turn-helix transcriptional regulator [Candidatus Aminicenantes bacterium]|nr:MAG: helix-turn-helix transcriptional regulator [Candidatus Aminicenantes bacterium]